MIPATPSTMPSSSPPSDRDPTRPAVVVSGASEGLGLALTRGYAARGHTVVLIARRKAPLEIAAGAIRNEFGTEAHVLSVDLTQLAAPEIIADALASWGLHADTLVNNAAVGFAGPLTDQTPAELGRLLDLNVRGLSLLTHRFLPEMRLRRRGAVLNVASVSGCSPMPYHAVYAASKAYVIAMTLAVSEEMRGQGVHVGVLVPGLVDTDFHARMGARRSRHLRLLPTSSAEQVAEYAIRRFISGATVIEPGLATKLLAAILRHAPSAPLMRLTGWLLHDRHLAAAGTRPSHRNSLISDTDSVRQLPAIDAIALAALSDTTLVDVREAGELEEQGAIPGAVHRPHTILELAIDPRRPSFDPIFRRTGPMIFICSNGLRSMAAARAAHEATQVQAATVVGGFRAWHMAGGPVVGTEQR